MQIAHNLCYCTLVPRDMVASMAKEDIITSPTGDKFVKPHKTPGVLPEILQELLAARKRAKKVGAEPMPLNFCMRFM